MPSCKAVRVSEEKRNPVGDSLVMGPMASTPLSRATNMTYSEVTCELAFSTSAAMAVRQHQARTGHATGYCHVKSTLLNHAIVFLKGQQPVDNRVLEKRNDGHCTLHSLTLFTLEQQRKQFTGRTFAVPTAVSTRLALHNLSDRLICCAIAATTRLA